MPTSDRDLVGAWWDEAWNQGLWAASWSKSIDGLTPQQAAWIPAPGRHSIWQIVMHMVFWRESWIRRAADGVKPSPTELATLNFPTLTDTSAAAWETARKRFAESQDNVAKAIRQAWPGSEPLMYLLPHDCYHFGQINYLRAMQGLKAIE